MIWKIQNSWFIYLHHVKKCYFLQNERDLAWDFLHCVEIRIISLTLRRKSSFLFKKNIQPRKTIVMYNFPPIFRGAEAFFDWETQKQKSSWNYIIHLFQDFLKNSWNIGIIQSYFVNPRYLLYVDIFVFSFSRIIDQNLILACRGTKFTMNVFTDAK